jgi:hypothetical protein
MSVVEVPLKKRMLLPWSFDHEVALSSSQSVGPLPQQARGAARRREGDKQTHRQGSKLRLL